MRLEIVEAARAGDAEQLEVLIRDVWPHAFRIALTVLHDASLAEDAAQEACAIVYARVANLRDSATFKVWFYRIVVREASRIRRLAQRGVSETQPSFRNADVDRTVARLDLAAALAKLSPAQRTVTVLHFYAGLTGTEIASVLGIPHGSVRFHLFRARKRLGRLLSDDVDALPFESMVLDAV